MSEVNYLRVGLIQEISKSEAVKETGLDSKALERILAYLDSLIKLPAAKYIKKSNLKRKVYEASLRASRGIQGTDAYLKVLMQQQKLEAEKLRKLASPEIAERLKALKVKAIERLGDKASPDSKSVSVFALPGLLNGGTEEFEWLVDNLGLIKSAGISKIYIGIEMTMDQTAERAFYQDEYDAEFEKTFNKILSPEALVSLSSSDSIIDMFSFQSQGSDEASFDIDRLREGFRFNGELEQKQSASLVSGISKALTANRFKPDDWLSLYSKLNREARKHGVKIVNPNAVSLEEIKFSAKEDAMTLISGAIRSLSGLRSIAKTANKLSSDEEKQLDEFFETLEDSMDQIKAELKKPKRKHPDELEELKSAEANMLIITDGTQLALNEEYENYASYFNYEHNIPVVSVLLEQGILDRGDAMQYFDQSSNSPQALPLAEISQADQTRILEFPLKEEDLGLDPGLLVKPEAAALLKKELGWGEDTSFFYYQTKDHKQDAVIIIPNKKEA